MRKKVTLIQFVIILLFFTLGETVVDCLLFLPELFPVLLSFPIRVVIFVVFKIIQSVVLFFITRG